MSDFRTCYSVDEYKKDILGIAKQIHEKATMEAFSDASYFAGGLQTQVRKMEEMQYEIADKREKAKLYCRQCGVQGCTQHGE